MAVSSSGFGTGGAGYSSSGGNTGHEGSSTTVVSRSSTKKTKPSYEIPKKKRVPFTPPVDYIGKRNGLIGQSITDPNTGRDYVGTWNPWQDEGGFDPNSGFWSFTQPQSKEPFYDPTIPPGYKGYTDPQAQAKSQMDITALLALLSPGGTPMIERKNPAIGGTRYVNGRGGYSDFLGRGGF